MSNSKTIPLSAISIGEKCEVVTLLSTGNERRRMLDLGLVKGTAVEAVLKSPAGDPIAYYIRGAVIALRDDDANKISVRCLN